MKSGELNRRQAAPTDGLNGHPRRFVLTTHRALRQTAIGPINFPIGRSPPRFITPKKLQPHNNVCSVDSFKTADAWEVWVELLWIHRSRGTAVRRLYATVVTVFYRKVGRSWRDTFPRAKLRETKRLWLPKPSTTSSTGWRFGLVVTHSPRST